MQFDILYPVPQVSKPLGQVDLEEVTEEVFQVSSEVRGEPNLAGKDSSKRWRIM